VKRLEFDTYGTPEVLKFTEAERPQPGPGQVLVRVKAAGINPSDVKNVAGQFNSPLPRVPGRDFAGIIVEGPDDGAEVWGSGPGFGVARNGAHSEYFLMPAEWVSAKPASLTMEQAAAVGVPYVAAWSALIGVGALKAGETVLVVGVSGAVGRAATQIAHWKGALVLGGATSSRNPSGADAIIDTINTELDVEARALTGGRGVDLVLDAVGGPMFEPALKSLAPGGRHVAITSPVEQRVSFNLKDFYRNWSRLLGVNTMSLDGLETAGILEQLRAGFDGGFLTPPELAIWPFDKAVEAYLASTKREVKSKQVLVF
jgi:NADPH2:quinone reductase